MKSFLGLTLPLLAAASPVMIESIHNDAAPVISSTNAKEIPNSYMIKFKSHVNTHLAAKHHDWVQDLHVSTQKAKMDLKKRSQTPLVDDIFHGLKHTYNIAGSLMGYSGHFDEDTIEQIRRHPDVSHRARHAVVPVAPSTRLEWQQNASRNHTDMSILSGRAYRERSRSPHPRR
jgi:cerevisin